MTKTLRLLLVAILVTLSGCAYVPPSLSQSDFSGTAKVASPIQGKLDLFRLRIPAKAVCKFDCAAVKSDSDYVVVLYSPEGKFIRLDSPVGLPLEVVDLTNHFGPTLAKAMSLGQIMTNAGERYYDLTVTVAKPDFPPGGFTFDINVELVYEFTDTRDNRVLSRSVIASNGHKDLSSEFNGRDRRARAIFLAYENNIRRFVSTFKCCESQSNQ